MTTPDPTARQRQPGSPGVLIHPPILVGAALLAGLLLEAMAPIGPGLLSGPAWVVLAGLALFAGGAGLMAMALVRFQRAGTNVPTYKPALTLVTDGPYQFTRNPIYLGGCIAFAGLGFLLSSPWVILMVVPVALVIHFGVIKREEPYLEQRFGEPYRDYCRRVPRWL